MRRPNRVSHPWRCAHQQPLVAYFPPAKSLQQERPPSTSHLFGPTRPRRRVQRRQIYGLQLHPPGTTTAVSGEINYLLPPSAGGLLSQNPSKIGRSIQAVLKVVSAPARLWERGTRCFVGRLCVLERLLTICGVFGGLMIQGSKTCRRKRRTVYAIRIAVNRFFLHTTRHALEGGSRLQELKGRTEVMPTMAARDRKLGANGCRGASWSEDLTATPRS